MANPVRRSLLALVTDEELAVGDLVERVPASQPVVSQHLAILRDAGLVTVAKDGRRRLYRVDPHAMSQLRSFFDSYWSSSLDRLSAVAERTSAARPNEHRRAS